MKLSQIEKRIPQTLTNSKDIIQKDREHARRSSRARSTRGQENEAWALYKKKPILGVLRCMTILGTDITFAQSHTPLLEKYLIEGNCSSQPYHFHRRNHQFFVFRIGGIFLEVVVHIGSIALGKSISRSEFFKRFILSILQHFVSFLKKYFNNFLVFVSQ